MPAPSPATRRASKLTTMCRWNAYFGEPLLIDELTFPRTRVFLASRAECGMCAGLCCAAPRGRELARDGAVRSPGTPSLRWVPWGPLGLPAVLPYVLAIWQPHTSGRVTIGPRIEDALSPISVPRPRIRLCSAELSGSASSVSTPRPASRARRDGRRPAPGHPLPCTGLQRRLGLQ
jgi:hypothetical protein